MTSEMKTPEVLQYIDFIFNRALVQCGQKIPEHLLPYFSIVLTDSFFEGWSLRVPRSVLGFKVLDLPSPILNTRYIFSLVFDDVGAFDGKRYTAAELFFVQKLLRWILEMQDISTFKNGSWKEKLEAV